MAMGEESFESYANGDELSGKNGGTGWSAAWAGTTGKYSVTTAQAYAGTKSATGVNSNANLTRLLSVPFSAGVFYVAMRYSSALDSDFQFDLRTSLQNAYRLSLRRSGGVNLIQVFAAVTTTVLSGFTQNQWYLWEVTIIDSSHASFRVHNGTSWGSSTGSVAAAFTGSIDQVQINSGGAQTIWLDNISVTNPILPPQLNAGILGLLAGG